MITESPLLICLSGHASPRTLATVIEAVALLRAEDPKAEILALLPPQLHEHRPKPAVLPSVLFSSPPDTAIACQLLDSTLAALRPRLLIGDPAAIASVGSQLERHPKLRAAIIVTPQPAKARKLRLPPTLVCRLIDETMPAARIAQAIRS